jgi:deazaflavin-dependent oxidoreductase (nitroreductase family)
MPLPGVLARFNRGATNRITGRIAGRVPPFVLVEHLGRSSRRTYRTPVWAFARGDRLVVALTYGADADWVRNVLAGGAATITRRGRTRRYTAPRVVHGAPGLASVPWLVRPALRLMRVDEFLVLRADAR